MITYLPEPVYNRVKSQIGHLLQDILQHPTIVVSHNQTSANHDTCSEQCVCQDRIYGI